MKLKKGTRLKWTWPSTGTESNDKIMELVGYERSPKYGQAVVFRSKSYAGGRRTIAVSWITHINGRRVRVKR